MGGEYVLLYPSLHLTFLLSFLGFEVLFSLAGLYPFGAGLLSLMRLHLYHYWSVSEFRPVLVGTDHSTTKWGRRDIWA